MHLDQVGGSFGVRVDHALAEGRDKRGSWQRRFGQPSIEDLLDLPLTHLSGAEREHYRRHLMPSPPRERVDADGAQCLVQHTVAEPVFVGQSQQAHLVDPTERRLLALVQTQDRCTCRRGSALRRAERQDPGPGSGSGPRPSQF